ncbi:MAG: tRNA lysidine(34) synthetase TilS, partial [Verrucomicrobiota bacterium]
LLEHGRKILVAVSGGLDSMVLLHVFHALAPQWRWRPTVAHFNHQLRGRSSDADEKLVRQTAGAMKLPFVAGSANVRAFATKSKLSVEMAARKLRHEFFARLARERQIHEVALAHHADDQVELFFLRLLRGAGGEGVAGMKWRSPSPVDSKIMLVRPLLDLTKAELSAFAREHEVRFRHDATNFSLGAPRNRVRNELLPLLRRRYQPALARTVLRLMEIAGAESDFAGEAARQWLRSSKRESAPAKSQRRLTSAATREDSNFEKLPVAIQRRVVQSQLAELGVAADFELIESLRQSPDVFVSVGPEYTVSRDAKGKVNLRERQVPKFNQRTLAVKLGRAGEVVFDGVKFGWRFDLANRFARLQRKPGCEYFDADKVGGQITLRRWRPGDRFQPIGMKSALKLQDWFVNQKIPRARRRELIVAAAESGEVFWVEGLRIGEKFKLTQQTKRRLIWHWQGAETKKGIGEERRVHAAA